MYEASERDFQVVLAEDAISGLYDRGRQELIGIGVTLMNTSAISASAGGRSTPPRWTFRDAVQQDSGSVERVTAIPAGMWPAVRLVASPHQGEDRSGTSTESRFGHQPPPGHTLNRSLRVRCAGRKSPRQRPLTAPPGVCSMG
jgi:hypothetical protein